MATKCSNPRKQFSCRTRREAGLTEKSTARILNTTATWLRGNAFALCSLATLRLNAPREICGAVDSQSESEFQAFVDPENVFGSIYPDLVRITANYFGFRLTEVFARRPEGAGKKKLTSDRFGWVEMASDGRGKGAWKTEVRGPSLGGRGRKWDGRFFEGFHRLY